MRVFQGLSDGKSSTADMMASASGVLKTTGPVIFGSLADFSRFRRAGSVLILYAEAPLFPAPSSQISPTWRVTRALLATYQRVTAASFGAEPLVFLRSLTAMRTSFLPGFRIKGFTTRVAKSLVPE